MATPRTYVEAPTASPLPFGLLSVAVVPDDNDPHWQLGGTTYEPEFCGPASLTLGACEPGADDLEPIDGIAQVDGDPFVVYQLFQCRMPGGGIQAGSERARRSLQLGEGRAVELATATYLAAHEDAEDLTPTPGTAIHLVDAISLLTEWAGENYGGVPTFHLRNGLALKARSYGVVERDGITLRTSLGAPVAAGAGYGTLQGPGGDAPGAGEAWVYVTGQVVARRAPVIEVQPTFTTPGTNEFVALAMRPWVVSTECIVGAVLVDTAYGIPS